MSESRSSLYRSRQQQFAAEEQQAGSLARLLGSLRVFTAIVMLGALWQSIMAQHWAWGLVAFIALGFFILLVARHGKARRRQEYLGRLKQINAKELAYLDGIPAAGSLDSEACETGHSPDQISGEAYLNAAHPYSFDLDIFGQHSIFRLVNRCACFSGRERLAERLCGQVGAYGEEPARAEGRAQAKESTCPKEKEKILERQAAISCLAPLLDFRQQFLAKGQRFGEKPGETRELYRWLHGPSSPYNTPFFRISRYLLSFCALGLLVGGLVGSWPHAYWVLAVLFNLAFAGLFVKKINRIHAQLSRYQGLFDKFRSLLEHIGAQQFENDHLQSLSRQGSEAAAAIRQLTRVLDIFDQRLNFPLGLLLNGLFLTDFHSIAAIDKWRSVYREQMPGWLNSIFSFDELNSFANYAFNHPEYCYPDFQDEPFLKVEGLGHPLMKRGSCIPNDFASSSREKVVILTGANMSGKSTFLRSVGVNLVLAYAGAPVFARKFSCCLAGIYSSMRVSDSLSDDSSYFYAELKRLQELMEKLRAGEKLFVLLDEILKGTNSADKLFGSMGLVKEFVGLNCLCFIATHDLELGKMETTFPENIRNYCFESSLEQDQLHFDYLLKTGIARNKNATFLMRRSGLIE